MGPGASLRNAPGFTGPTSPVERCCVPDSGWSLGLKFLALLLLSYQLLG